MSFRVRSTAEEVAGMAAPGDSAGVGLFVVSTGNSSSLWLTGSGKGVEGGFPDMEA